MAHIFDPFTDCGRFPSDLFVIIRISRAGLVALYPQGARSPVRRELT